VGVDSENIFVCESRYSIQAKNSQKIKKWSTCIPESVRNNSIELELYDTPLSLKRAPLDPDVATGPTPNKRKRDEPEDTPAPKRRVMETPAHRVNSRVNIVFNSCHADDSIRIHWSTIA
jgi:hypothetical protein